MGQTMGLVRAGQGPGSFARQIDQFELMAKAVRDAADLDGGWVPAPRPFEPCPSDCPMGQSLGLVR